MTKKRTSGADPREADVVARQHFLRDGIDTAIAGKIAEEAGFSRGALYANFKSKDDLFLAVVESSAEANGEHFQSILRKQQSAKQRLVLTRFYGRRN